VAEVLDTKGRTFYIVIIILVIAAVILFLVVGYPLLHSKAAPVPAGSQPPPNKTVTVTVTSVQGRNTPVVTATVPASPDTVPGANTALPSSAPTPLPTSMPQTTAITPVPFSLLVTPQSASARPGDTLTYTLAIQHGEGLTGPIHFSLAAHVLFFSQTYDLGTVDPPFPKSIRYDFVVPGNLPSGVTVNGVVTATGDGQTETEEISLNVL
jgi:hypothetical protein